MHVVHLLHDTENSLLIDRHCFIRLTNVHPVHAMLLPRALVEEGREKPQASTTPPTLNGKGTAFRNVPRLAWKPKVEKGCTGS